MQLPQRAGGGRAAAAGIGAVDHVVVDESGAVDHLDHGAQADGALTAIARGTRGQQKERGAHTLAATLTQIAGDFYDRLNGAAILGRNFLLDQSQIVANLVKFALCDLNGKCHSF